MGATVETMNAEVLPNHDCVIDAAVETFAATCGIDLQLKDTHDAHELAGAGVIIAIISLVGDVEWSLLIGLPREPAVTAATSFAGFDIDFDSEDMSDAVGELANILAGTVKAKLDQRGLKAEISLPSVMRGEHLQILAQRNIKVALSCFDTSAGKLWTGVLSSAGPPAAA